VVKVDYNILQKGTINDDIIEINKHKFVIKVICILYTIKYYKL